MQHLLHRFSNRFVSRWLILAFDVLIVCFSFGLANLLRFNFNISHIDFDVVRDNFLFLFYIRLACFFYFRSYTGIVRHTSLEDALHQLKVVSVGTFIAGFISFIVRYWGNFDSNYFVPFSILLIDYLICSFLLVISRVLVKIIYDTLTASLSTSKKALIYGAGYSGRITKNVLQNDKHKSYQILGFIDDNPDMVGKTIEGIRVYSQTDALDKFIKNNNKAIEIIVAINNISAAKKRTISDVFLTNNIVVKVLPSMDKWVEGEFSINQIHAIKIEDLLERESINLNNPLIYNEIKSRVVMVTGAAGSIGSEIVRQVLQYEPSQLILIDQAESAMYDLEFEIKDKIQATTSVKVMIADISDKLRMERLVRFTKPNVIFHAAAYKHVPMMESNPYEAIKTNIMGVKVMADLAAEYEVDKFIMISTDKAVNPTNVMGATKRVAEMYTQSLNQINGISTKYIATRFGNVLGSNGSVIPLFEKQIAKGGPITVTHPDITRYFMTIPEACQLVLEAGTMGKGGDVFVFDMGEAVKIIDLAKKMISLSGLRLNKDINIVFTGLRPGEKLYEELLNDNENTLPTHHTKIMRAKVVAPCFAEMEIHLNKLEKLLQNGNNRDLISQLKNIVPEYISNNSVYEELDAPKQGVLK